jgi:hypothetical protein
MTTNRNYDYLIKLLLIGDSGTHPTTPFHRARRERLGAKNGDSPVVILDTMKLTLFCGFRGWKVMPSSPV